MDDHPDVGVFVVEYERNKAAYWLHNPITEEAIYIFDVIGNFHDKPELLQQET